MLKFLAKQCIALTLAICTACALAAGDPNDAAGAADHAEVPRFPGYYIDTANHHDFQQYLFPTGGEDRDGNPKGISKSGRYWEINYQLNENARRPSPVELIRNYENAFVKAGGRLVYRDPGDGVMRAAAVFQVKKGNAERWVHVSYGNGGDAYSLHVVDAAEMKQQVEVTVNEMADAIRKNGYVALHGILFDTGKASIKQESTPLLAEVAALMNRDKALRLSVEGHTDNVGDKKLNLELSRKRAESVVRHLTANGIDAGRLKADGKGDTAPIADNRSEDGRARNRRVELVKF